MTLGAARGCSVGAAEPELLRGDGCELPPPGALGNGMGMVWDEAENDEKKSLGFGALFFGFFVSFCKLLVSFGLPFLTFHSNLGRVETTNQQ